MPSDSVAPLRLRDHAWALRYRTSAQGRDGAPTDIIRDFYNPLLACAVRYDRVAGYFRSSSLAAASQGFTALAHHGGRARLVVGADLDPDDVAAALRGEDARLTRRLLAELEPRGLSDPVRHGLELLAWLVARGHLELRVALRVHARTGDALSIDDVSDGYVHEKWAVVTDAGGDRLYFTGSLNESRTSLVLNAESFDVHCAWKGEEARQRVASAESDFGRLWADEEPALRVIPLPEAVRLELVKLADRIDRPVEIDGSSALPRVIPPPSAEEIEQFSNLHATPRLPGGEWVGMATAPVSPWPHQEIVARRLIETFPFSWLLCDEVGLGKTIEAGLAIRSLVLSGRAKRVLIAAPASLTRQWQRELATKFLLDFGRAAGGKAEHVFILGGERTVPTASVYAPDLTIISTGLLARKDRADALSQAKPWDLVLVDEAHYARRKNPRDGAQAEPEYGLLYRAIETLRAKAACLWLATATPMQLDRIEAWDLMRLTRRVGSFAHDPSTTVRYYECLDQLSDGLTLDDDDDELVRRAVLEIQHLDPPLWTWLLEVVVDPASRVAVRQWLEQGRRPRGRDGDGLRRLIFAAAPLSRVMLRHTRELLEVYRAHGELTAGLARRHVRPLRAITFSNEERRIYDALEDYCDGLAERLTKSLSASRARGAVQFYLSFLRLRFVSSLHAIGETLKRRLERVEATLRHERSSTSVMVDDDMTADDVEECEDDEAIEVLLKDRAALDLSWERDRLRSLLHDLADLSVTPSKVREVLEELQSRRRGTRFEQTVIFTRFADTMNDIVRRLRALEPQMRLATYSGDGGWYVDPETLQWAQVERDVVKARFVAGEIDILVCTDAAAEGLNLQTADLLINFDLPWNPMKVEQRIGRIDRIGQVHADIHVLNLAYAGSAEEIVYGRLLDRLESVGLVVGLQQLSLLPVTPGDFAELAKRNVSEAAIADIQQRAEVSAKMQQARSRSLGPSASDQYGMYRRLNGRSTAEQSSADLDKTWKFLVESPYLKALGCHLDTGDAKGRVLSLNGVPGLPSSLLTADRNLYEQGVIGLDRPLHFAAHGDPAFHTLLGLFGRCGTETSIAPNDDSDRVARARGAEALNDEASLSQILLILAAVIGWLESEQRLGNASSKAAVELRRLEQTLSADRGRLHVRLAPPHVESLRCRLFEFACQSVSTTILLPMPRWVLWSGLGLAQRELSRFRRKDGAVAPSEMLRSLLRLRSQLLAEHGVAAKMVPTSRAWK